MTRPAEIQTLIDWLREPGRTCCKGDFAKDGQFCAVGKLYFDAGVMTVDGKVNIGRSNELDDRLDISPRVWNRITALNDKEGPLAVAEYLEAEFPS